MGQMNGWQGMEKSEYILLPSPPLTYMYVYVCTSASMHVESYLERGEMGSRQVAFNVLHARTHSGRVLRYST